MGRYYNRGGNWGDKLFGGFLLGCLAVFLLALIYAGLKWCWYYVFG